MVAHLFCDGLPVEIAELRQFVDHEQPEGRNLHFDGVLRKAQVFQLRQSLQVNQKEGVELFDGEIDGVSAQVQHLDVLQFCELGEST